MAGKLDAMSPLSTLSRGYAIGYNLTKNTPICSIDDVVAGDEIKMKLKDGSVFSTVKEKTKEKEA